MQYKVGENLFSFSYQELKIQYQEYKNMTDEEFCANIPKLLHFVCFICYLKEVPTSVALADYGIVHQLVHLLDDDTSDDPIINLSDIREEFNIVCELV